MPAAPDQPTIVVATDEEIEAIIAEFGGDHRQAIRALLHDLTELAMDSEAAVSRGFVRGRLLPFRLRDAGRKSHEREEWS